jgi:hypothetical protein
VDVENDGKIEKEQESSSSIITVNIFLIFT